MPQRVLPVLLALAALLAACAAPGPGPAPTDTSRTAQLSELRNTVEARESPSGDWQPAGEGQQIAAGGGVKTGDDSRARLDTSDGTILRLAANTEFQLAELSPGAADPVTQLSLTAGKLWVSVTSALGGGSFEVETPNGVAAVRGSLMGVEYYPANGQMIITCLEGQCRLTQPGTGSFTELSAGQQTGIPGFGLDPGPARAIDVVRLGEWAQAFPEALSIVATITPGPPPSATPSFTPGPPATPTPIPPAW